MVKIKVLIENNASAPGFLSEHGLSLYLETERRRILFDAGQSGQFAVNAEKIGVDLAMVDTAILSHGHYDHGGGLERFLELNEKAPVYVNVHAFEPHFNGKKDIGLSPSLRESGRLILVGERTALDENMELFPMSEFTPEYPVASQGLSVIRDGVRADEDFRHEQYLLIRDGGKRILFSGCSHAGILNIAGWFRPDVLVGGFHFKNLDPEGEGRAVLEQAAEALKKQPTVYYTCHCTGTAQYEFLRERMGYQIRSLTAGQELVL